MTGEPLTPARMRTMLKGQRIRDNRVPALHYQSLDVGRGSFYLKYRARATGTERTIKIGSYPDIGLDAARSVARDMLQQVAQGRDPKAEWSATRAEPTVAELVDKFIATYRGAESTKRDYEGRARSPIFAATPLARMRVNEVTREHANAFLASVRDGKHSSKAVDRKGVGANRYRALLHRVFNLARWDWNVRTEALGNPFEGTKRAPEQARRRRLSPQEVARFTDAIDTVALDLPLPCAAIELMLWTGLRPNEVQRCKSEWRDGNVIRYPEHKTAGSIGDKEVILPTQAVALLDRTRSPDGYLFGRNIALRWTWERIRELAGMPDLQMRDLRRSFASTGLDGGKSLLQVGKFLGHTNPQTTNRYAWMLESGKEQMAQEIADEIERRSKGTSQINGS